MNDHLTKSVREYIRAARQRLHVPAHGGGPGNPALDRLFPGLLAWDVTEQPELDDLSHPQGPIRDAQMAAASLFGAASAYFLTGGATLGVQAAILAAIGEGGSLLLGRDSHRSAIGALAIADGTAVLADPDADATYGVSLGISPRSVERAICAHAGVRAVLVTYPTYLGVAPRLGAISEVAHRHGLWVIADAAHGAHFGLDPQLPPAALASGADLAVLGMHKTGGALTQTALLLLGDRAHGELSSRVQTALHLLQTSSPSYPLLVSIEQALVQIAGGAPGLHAAVAVGMAIEGAARVRTDLPQDPLRVALRCPSPGHAAALWHQLANLGVRGEYLEGAEVLYAIPWGARDLSRLGEAVAAMPAPAAPERSQARPLARVRPRAALFARREQVILKGSEGRIAADVVAVVPPGIPALWPGEEIGRETLGRLEQAYRAGHRVAGIENQSVWVVAE